MNEELTNKCLDLNRKLLAGEGDEWEVYRLFMEAVIQPEAPAIEYCITAGPGTLLELGVTTEPMEFQSQRATAYDTQYGMTFPYETATKLHTAPTTTACMTGK